MLTTIDHAGRVVIPKQVREELGLRGGQKVEIVLRDGHIEIDPVASPIRLVERDGFLLPESNEEVPPLTSEQVREALERVRR